MIRIREFRSCDVEKVQELYDKFFSRTHEFPDFLKYICAFVLEDEQGIITAGGVCNIAECVAVTDLDRHPMDRIQALYQLLNASTFVCKHNNFDQMYVWSQDAKYSRRLMRNGFRLSKGQSLVLDL